MSPMPAEPYRGRAKLLVLASAALFGTTGTAQALGPAGTDPATVGTARIAVGGALLMAWAAASGALGRGGWPARSLGVAAVGVAAYQVCFFAAVARTGVALGTVVALGSAPALTGLLGLAVLGERPSRRWALATVLAVAGGGLVAASAADVGTDGLGVLLAGGAGASYAAYTLAAKDLLERGVDPSAVMGAAFALSALLLAPVLVLGNTAWLARPSGWALAAYLGVVPTALAYVLFARGLARLPAASVATLTLAEPLTATMLGVLVLGERPTALATVGAALLLGGIAVLAGEREETKRTARSGNVPGGLGTHRRRTPGP